ncbi:MAG: polyprenyl synthetase family protein [Candidatus Omnitrophota bacterium]
MFKQLKNRVNKELTKLLAETEKNYKLSAFSPFLARSIKEFILREGKRLRPILFIIGYLGFSPKGTPGLYRSAAAIEILHSFFLVHDDIIDKAVLRRGKPSMHQAFNNYLKRYKKTKFSGEDLAIVTGDIMYALAIEAFLSIKEQPRRKENALRKFAAAALYTACGEFADTFFSTKSLRKTTLKDIYVIYDYKTAFYSFVCPLTTGALLAGAAAADINKLSQYGMRIGRAFQIKDDILGIFGYPGQTGKSSLTDLQEAKKTILIWHAYNHSLPKEQKFISKVFSKNKVQKSDLTAMRKIIRGTRSIDYAEQEISRLLQSSTDILASSKIKPDYKNTLEKYSRGLLQI